MGIFDHTRVKIVSQLQHPYKHDVSEFFYAPTALPGVSNVEDALDYIIAVLYPKYIGTYATMAALLLAVPAPTQNDYALVSDDGDGKAAGYVYSTIDGVAAWNKRYDVDWSMEAILSETTNRTQYMYVHKYGVTDLDATGTAIVGTYAGQKQYGGNLTGQNLTLNANSVDATGYVQTDNIFRPTADGTLDLGMAGFSWRTGYFSTSVVASTLTVAGGSITDSTGAISFSNENLSTTGTLASGALTVTGAGSVTTTFTVASDLVLGSGSITSVSGAISFGNENLSTTGTVTGATGSAFGSLTLANGSITDSSGDISFGNENLLTTGTLGSGNTTVTRLDADSIRLDGSAISVTLLDTSLTIAANGTGVIDMQSAMTTLGQTVTGVLGVTGQLNIDNLRLDANTISSTNLNGAITLSPNGSGTVGVTASILPSATGTLSLGTTTGPFLFNYAYLAGGLGDATNTISIATLLSFRSALVGANTGMTLFYNGVSGLWEASAPDTEVDHGSISGLADDDHTQYMLLAGRAGGQTLVGGTLTTQNLTLRPNAADTTTGAIVHSGIARPEADNTRDLGTSSFYWKDLYVKGQAYNLRIENTATIGSLTASAGTKGRIAYALDDTKTYIDTGGTWKVMGVSKYQSDTSWNGTDLTKTVTVSASLADARTAIWALYDNANSFVQIFADITLISATQITITTNTPLASGSYRLIGLE